MTPYTIEKVPIDKMLPIKSISEFNPGYIFVLEHTRNNKTVLPVILSKNFRILDGHKSLKAILAIYQEKFGDTPKTISVFISDREMTEGEAWEMHYIYNKKHAGTLQTMYALKSAAQNRRNTCADPTEATSQSAIALQELYQITSPIRTHLISALFADKLSSISVRLHKELSDAFTRTLDMGLNQHVE